MTSAIAFVIVMAFHPSAHGHGAGGDGLASRIVLVHALALIAGPATFLGLLGAARRFAGSVLVTAALVAAGYATVAVMGAALASGFVFPDVVDRIACTEDPGVTHALLLYTGAWNQAFAKVHVVAFSLGILCWSSAMLRDPRAMRFPRASGAGGLALGAAVLAALLTGHVHLDLHGARIVWIAQSVWVAWLGILALLDPPSASRGVRTAT